MFLRLLPDYSARMRNETRHIRRQLKRRRRFIFGKIWGQIFNFYAIAY